MSLDEMAERFRQIVQRVESGAQPEEEADGQDVDDAGDTPPSAVPGLEQDGDQPDDDEDDPAGDEDDEENDGDAAATDLDAMRSQFQQIAQRAQTDGGTPAPATDPVDDRRPADPDPTSPAGADQPEDRNPASPPPAASDPTAQAGAMDDEPDGRLPDLPDDDQDGQPDLPAADPGAAGDVAGSPGSALVQRLGALVQRITGAAAGSPTAPPPPAGQPGQQQPAAPGAPAPGQPGEQQPGGQPGGLPPGYKPGSREVWDAVVQRLAAGGHPLTRATVEQTLVGLGHDRPKVVAEMSAVHPQHVHGRLSDARKKMVDQTWGQLGKAYPTLPMGLGDVAVNSLAVTPRLRRRRRRFQAVVAKHR